MPPIPHALRNDPVGSYPEEWALAFAEMDERPFRARQVFRWIHTRSVADPAAMTDLARSLRDKLMAWEMVMPATIEKVHRAGDGTRKVLVGFAGSVATGTVETVLIPPMPGLDDEEDDDSAGDDPRTAPMNLTPRPPLPGGRGGASHWNSIPSPPSPARERGVGGVRFDEERRDASDGMRAPARRVTQCISTQVGCAMGCVFCASGVAGLKRHLTAGEIVAQVLLGRTLLDPGEAIRNVVLMGMGEPLHNYEAVARALRLLTHREGLDLSTRRVTVSTSGLVPEIERLGRDFHGEIALAVSLHAPDDTIRGGLMPINRKYPLAELMTALRNYPLARRRRITIEYTLIAGVNDGADHARAMVRLLRGIPVKINLIPMNPVEGTPFRAPTRETVLAFQSVLRAENLSVFIRRTRGDDIDAACGQLALKGAKPVRRVLPLEVRRG